MQSQQEAKCPILLFQYILKHWGDKKEGESWSKLLQRQRSKEDEVPEDEVLHAVVVVKHTASLAITAAG